MRAALVAATLALLATPSVALAEDAQMMLGTQVFFGGGGRVGAAAAPTNVELSRGGWSSLPVAFGEGQGGFGITIFDATIDVHFQGGEYTLAGPGAREDALAVYTSAIGVELGYRARVGRFVTLQPFVGIGSVGSTLCFYGVPSDATDGTRSPFQQVLSNPARGTCLEATDVGLDLGLNALASFPFALSEVAAGYRMAGWFGVGPRFAFTVPLSFTRTWDALGSSDAPIDLPAFEGPVAPLGGAYVGVNLVFRAGLARAR